MYDKTTWRYILVNVHMLVYHTSKKTFNARIWNARSSTQTYHHHHYRKKSHITLHYNGVQIVVLSFVQLLLTDIVSNKFSRF